MKPYTVHNIHIDGAQRNAAQHLRELERDVARLHRLDYEAAGICPDCHEKLVNGVCPTLHALQETS